MLTADTGVDQGTNLLTNAEVQKALGSLRGLSLIAEAINIFLD